MLNEETEPQANSVSALIQFRGNDARVLTHLKQPSAVRKIRFGRSFNRRENWLSHRIALESDDCRKQFRITLGERWSHTNLSIVINGVSHVSNLCYEI